MNKNRPKKITDVKSDLIKRLIDVVPKLDKVSVKKYNRLIKQINF